jgi:hypothetical protein
MLVKRDIIHRQPLLFDANRSPLSLLSLDKQNYTSTPRKPSFYRRLIIIKGSIHSIGHVLGISNQYVSEIPFGRKGLDQKM